MEKTEKPEKVKTKRFFVMGDLAIYAIALFLIVVFTFYAVFVPTKKGEYFTIEYKYKEVFSASLKEDAEYLITEENGKCKIVRVYPGIDYEYEDYNLIKVENGFVWVKNADCANHNCINEGKISSGLIICSPHNIAIVIRGDGLGGDV